MADLQIDKLLLLARTARESENPAEAYKYYTQVLELDPTNAEAWLGKGVAAGWQSTLAHPRLREAQVAMKNAMEHASPDDSAAMLAKVVDATVTQAGSFHTLAWNHYLKYSASSPTLESQLEYERHTVEALECILSAVALDGTRKDVLSVAIDFVGGRMGQSLAGLPNLRPKLEAIRDNLIEKMESLDPSYQAPVVKKSSCFVATATMGDIDHPYCRTLRVFRERVLIGTPLGRRIIEWYYRHGPSASAVVESSRFLRCLCRVGVVGPAAFWADAWMRSRAKRESRSMMRPY